MQKNLGRFTLNYEEFGDYYNVWFTDINYTRGDYHLRVGNWLFSSIWCPEFVGNGTIRIPGTHKDKDNNKILIPRGVLNSILNHPTSFGEDWDQDAYFLSACEGFQDRYFVPRLKPVPENIRATCTCKETLLQYCVSPIYAGNNQRVIYLSENFIEGDLMWLTDIQNKIEPENRFKVTILGPNCLKFEFPEWWLGEGQGYYRLGWAMLALRLIKKRYIPKSGDEKFFNAFKNGKWNVKNIGSWGPTNNWVSAFTTTSLFE